MNLPERKPMRLQGYDYSSSNYYFITVCAYNKKHLFGEINCLSELGELAKLELSAIPSHFCNVCLDRFVVMPNHIHAVLIIGGDNSAGGSRPTPTISTVVGQYKAGVSRKFFQRHDHFPIWQRSFYDHVIRGREDYDGIINYIEMNPAKWEEDRFYVPE